VPERGFAVPGFVVIEGNNGTGKTTVAEGLAAQGGAVRFHFPTVFGRFRREAGLDEGMDPLPRLAYYLAATVHLSSLVEAEVADGRAVVCDRYLAAPLSLLVADGSLDDDEVCRLSEPFVASLARPRATLLLVAGHAVATARILRRAAERTGGRLTPVERSTVESPGFFAAREAALRRHASRVGPVVELDTTALTAEDVLPAAQEALASPR
jgi:thymidylate kinase